MTRIKSTIKCHSFSESVCTITQLDWIAMVYIDNVLPVKATDYLPSKQMGPLSGSHYNYNYNDGNSPIYPLDGSQLIYELSISTITLDGTLYHTVLYNTITGSL